MYLTNVFDNMMTNKNTITNKNPTLSVCSFMMNEEEVVGNMLESIKSINPDEVVILDEYSSDDTRDILKSYFSDVKIIDGKLECNYSRIRNLAISYATKNWILFIDADEILEQPLCDALKSRELLIYCERKGYDLVGFKRKNYIDNIFMGESKSYPDFQYRLIKNNKKIIYTGYIHEWPIGYKNKFSSNYHIIHNKTSDRQMRQDIKYNQIYRQYGMLRKINPKYP